MMNHSILVSKDLLFGGRVRSAAQRAGRACDVVSPDQVDRCAVAPQLIMIDLAAIEEEGLAELVESCRRLAPAAHVIAYGPHVDAERLENARRAGCDEVLSRGEFNQRLPDFFAPAE